MTLNLNILNKYRTPLTGLAMLLVITNHTTIGVPYYWPSFLTLTFYFLKENSYVGVDIFFFLSSFGLYFSLNKTPSTKEFYKKRFLRIFPYYIPIAILVSIHLNLSVPFFLGTLTTLGFWIHKGSFEWFIPSLIVFYLATPFFFKWFNRSRFWSVFIVSIFGILLSLNNLPFCYTMFTARIPIYFIGFYFGYLASKNTVLNTKHIFLCLFSFIVGSLFLYLISHYRMSMTDHRTDILFYPLILITPPLILFWAKLFSLFKPVFLKWLTFLGKYSLVIYLLQERIYYDLLCSMHLPLSNLNMNILTLFLTLPLAWVYQNFIDFLVAKFTKSRKI